MDAGGERPVVVELEDHDFVLRETVILHIGVSPEAGPEAPTLEEASMHLAEDKVEGEVHEDGISLMSQEETTSSGVAVDVPSTTGSRGKVFTEEDVGSDSDMDVEELRMIDEVLTQLEVGLEGGSKTIAIPMDHNFLINTEEIDPSLDLLCSEIQGTTLETVDGRRCHLIE